MEGFALSFLSCQAFLGAGNLRIREKGEVWRNSVVVILFFLYFRSCLSLALTLFNLSKMSVNVIGGLRSVLHLHFG